MGGEHALGLDELARALRLIELSPLATGHRNRWVPWAAAAAVTSLLVITGLAISRKGEAPIERVEPLGPLPNRVQATLAREPPQDDFLSMQAGSSQVRPAKFEMKESRSTRAPARNIGKKRSLDAVIDPLQD